MNMKKLTSSFIVALFSILVLTYTPIMSEKASSPKTEFHLVLLNQGGTVDYILRNNIMTAKITMEYDIIEGSLEGSMISSGTVIWNFQSDIAVVTGCFVLTTNDGNKISGTSFAMIRGYSKGPVYFEIVQYTFEGHGYMNIKGTLRLISATEIGMDGYSW
jgi:hypothetical protein